MTLRPRRKRIKISAAILILFSKSEEMQDVVIKALAQFEGADDNDNNWPTSLKTLAVTIEDAEVALKDNETSLLEHDGYASAIEIALDEHLNP